MGTSQSSYQQYHNDFELVIRVTKEMEWILESKFGAPNGKKDGLHDKITFVQEKHGLSINTVKKMRYLVTLRNKLVHDHKFNSLPDRQGFARSYDQVELELKKKVVQNGGSIDSACIIS